MNRGIIILTLASISIITTVHIFSASAQVADHTIGGIIVPKGVSTQANYCFNGICSSGTIPKIPVNYTKSIHHLPVILISLSGTCETMNKQGMSDCPSIKELMKYDTSNQYISGRFVNHYGVYTREPPQVKNNWLIYSYSKDYVVCVECTFDNLATTQSKQIIIQPRDFVFVNKTAIVSKNMWVSWEGRYMQGCDTATISNRPGLLNDTISYMLSGCTKTSFNGTQSYTIPDKPWEYNNPYSSLVMASHYKTILQGHYIFGNKTSGGLGPSDCIRHTCDLTTSTKKW